MYGYGHSLYLTTRSIFANSASGGGVDPDAQAFITAAAITNPTQQSAINQLVLDLKGYGVWTKMKAIYPFVGGTASTHKFNLKNPLDTNAAYRLVFSGGWTHSANGALSNGVNGFADTFLANNVLAQNSNHISAYSRKNSNTTSTMIASWNSSFGVALYPRNIAEQFQINNNAPTAFSVSNVDSRGFFLNSRTASNSLFSQKNTVQSTSNVSSTNHITTTFKLSRTGEFNGEYSNREIAFASLGDGLSQIEASNFYTAVQAFQTTLGRSIGTQTVSDADAQAFVTAANIQDQVEANAVNNLVIGMKADGVWSKGTIIKPFIGGTAAQHLYNLKTASQIGSFSGGVTHDSNGVTFNGINGFHNSGYQTTSTNIYNRSAFWYIREVTTGTANGWMGNFNGGVFGIQAVKQSTNYVVWSDGLNRLFAHAGSILFDKGLLGSSIISNISGKVYNKSTIKVNLNSISNTPQDNGLMYSGALNQSGTAILFGNHNIAFEFYGDGLTDTESLNLNTRVQQFQTSLNRNV